MKVVVVGAGVLGASAAAELVRRGADVTLVDAAGPGAGTSSRGAGLVCEGMWHPTSLRLVQRSMELLKQMSDEGRRDGTHPFRYHVAGSTTLVPERIAEAAKEMARHQAAHGAHVRVLSPEEAAKLPLHESMSMDGAALALHYPRDGWALPRMYCELTTYRLWLDEQMRLVRSPARLVRDGPRVLAEVEGERLQADAVVVATGIHTRGLLREVGLDVPLLAYRTQAARVNAPDAHQVPILHDAVQGFYLRPHWTDQLVAGNGTTLTPEEISRWKRDADNAFVERTRQRVVSRFPSLANAQIPQAWAGLDAATPDRLMIAGAHPAQRGLWVLAGGNGHGFMRGPAAGESLAALVLGDKPPVPLTGYEPDRFGTALTGDAFEIREGYTLESPCF